MHFTQQIRKAFQRRLNRRHRRLRSKDLRFEALEDRRLLTYISIDDVWVSEGDGTAEFTVSLDMGTDDTVTVDYSTSDNTAIAGSDYTSSSGTVTFDPWVTSQNVSIPLSDDSLDEEDETFEVSLSNAVNGSISMGIGIATTPEQFFQTPPLRRIFTAIVPEILVVSWLAWFESSFGRHQNRSEPSRTFRPKLRRLC